MNAFVSLKSVDKATGDKARALYATWRALAGERIAPSRADIKLRHVHNLSLWLWRVDVISGGDDFLFRLAGDRVVQFYGQNFIGHRLSELPQDAFVHVLGQICRHCVVYKTPQLVGPRPSSFTGKNFMEVEASFLPLSENGTDITSLIGTMEFWPLGTHFPAEEAPREA